MSNGFGNNGSNSGHRVSRRDKKQQRRDDVNGDQDRTDGFKKPARPAHQFNGGEKKNSNGNGNHSGMQIRPSDTTRSAILQQIDDLKHRGKKWNPVATSGDDFYISLDPESDAGKKHMAALLGLLEHLKAGKPEPGLLPRHDTGPAQER